MQADYNQISSIERTVFIDLENDLLYVNLWSCLILDNSKGEVAIAFFHAHGFSEYNFQIFPAIITFQVYLSYFLDVFLPSFWEHFLSN